MGAAVGGGKGPRSDINITPLVDVVLVLLIIFMVMAPQMRKGPDVNLPNTTKPNGQGDERGRILVSIDQSGGLWINDQSVTAEHFGEALQAAGVFVGGAGLESPQAATTVSVRDGKRQVHDGPYAETKEFLAGFAIIDVPNLDVALEWAARHPAAGHSSVEVRPLLGSYFAVGGNNPS